MPDLVGQRLGNYHLVRLLGQGAFAAVYLGEHLHLRTQAALKVLHTRLSDEDHAAFFQEARVIAALSHPNIVRIFDFGVQENTLYLVMDYAPHGSLRQRHQRGVQVPLEIVVSYVKQIAGALQYAHEQRLIHRDVKPENLLLGWNQEVMIADFGMALIAQSTRSQSMKEAVGTLSYMAPEQTQGFPHRASDQYALAAVVYEWLSGKVPFRGSPTEVLAQHLVALPAPLRASLDTLSPAVEEVVLRALAKDPKDRFSSARAFAEALEAASRPGVPSLAPPVGAIPVATPRVPDKTIRMVDGQVGAIHALAWSPDGRLLAVAGAEGARVVRAENGAEVCTSTGHTDAVLALAWSPDGERVASAGADATVQVWEGRTGKTLLSYEGHSDTVYAVSWSPDGKRVASASDDTTVQVWTARTGKPLLTYEKHGDYVRAVAWSPDGRQIASASDDGTVQVWAALDGEGQGWFRGETGKITALAWAPAGGALALGGDDGTVQVWEVEEKRVRLALRGHTGALTALAWAPGGERLASAAYDGAVHLWDASAGQRLLTYRAASSDDAWLYVQKARAWWGNKARVGRSKSRDDLEEDAEGDSADEPDSEEEEVPHEAVLALAWSPDGQRLASGGSDGSIHIWQA
jgi:WD40 repeat protein